MVGALDLLMPRLREKPDVAGEQTSEQRMALRRALRGSRQRDPVARQLRRAPPMRGGGTRSSLHRFIQILNRQGRRA